MFEICLTFTEGKAKIMLLSPNMRPFCWRHSGSIADRSAGWITISLSLSEAGSRPGWVHNGYKCLTALKWFHQAGSIEITLAWLSTRLVNGFDESGPDLASNLQDNQLQSISIGETYRQELVGPHVNLIRWKYLRIKIIWKLWNVDGNFSHFWALSGSPWECQRVSNNLQGNTGISKNL